MMVAYSSPHNFIALMGRHEMKEESNDLTWTAEVSEVEDRGDVSPHMQLLLVGWGKAL